MNPGILTLPTQYATMPRGLLGRPTPVPMINAVLGIHPEALDWQSRVVANGGLVSAQTLDAVSQFCNAIDENGIRGLFYRLNLFCGTGLSAALVPLYRGQSPTGTQLGGSTDANNNLVSADYVEFGNALGGLKGNGVNKDLSTGFNPVTVGATGNNMHLAAYVRGTEAAGTTRAIIGNDPAALTFGLGWASAGTQEQVVFGAQVRASASSVSWDGFLGGSGFLNAIGQRAQQYYRNGFAAGAVSNVSLAQGDVPNAVVRVLSGGGGLFSLARYVRAYSFGLSLNATQWRAYNAIMQRFQATLGRNV